MLARPANPMTMPAARALSTPKQEEIYAHRHEELDHVATTLKGALPPASRASRVTEINPELEEERYLEARGATQ
jgi:hypothetical protein